MGQPVARVSDLAFCPADVHGCPACPHPVNGPAIQGSPDVLVNGLPVLRVGDPGIHAACCGPNTWKCAQGSSGVFVNDLPVVRLGDSTTHCGGVGAIITGSGDLFVGDMCPATTTVVVVQDGDGITNIIVNPSYPPPSMSGTPEAPPGGPSTSPGWAAATNYAAAVNNAVAVNDVAVANYAAAANAAVALNAAVEVNVVVEVAGAVTTALVAAEAVAVGVAVLI